MTQSFFYRQRVNPPLRSLLLSEHEVTFPSSLTLRAWCYQYTYDHLLRVWVSTPPVWAVDATVGISYGPPISRTVSELLFFGTVLSVIPYLRVNYGSRRDLPNVRIKKSRFVGILHKKRGKCLLL